ncbi:hypothetical protein [Aggregatibacter actinomycetemcomitans]|uniref:hypothetical protein n=1 Tax=Aggregatibacter actinomycetemcomitans TaxID=714 RepID=UPI00023FFF2F|nr:hypothetical protein [Aggregatibacter actinomycetemcomitans]EHK90593.1 hypothetical protein RHAA1_05303 [Aggregatibacter actinomycetemcomitans RhAA1]KNE77643.1 hypothetical protein RHAA2_05385 [Aggregatibacter actinomycetemcomitans RhAA1]MBN6076924.1 hypothetical protein [Aggregatibacter actinomycetemcomitans]MBN6077246.1 hypothetical protein [Aggregatibacter actinomycetemcomitans]MBN6077370.1 hypothetical protein [Aggregatibacter actinomycetemcomitans]
MKNDKMLSYIAWAIVTLPITVPLLLVLLGVIEFRSVIAVMLLFGIAVSILKLVFRFPFAAAVIAVMFHPHR